MLGVVVAAVACGACGSSDEPKSKAAKDVTTIMASVPFSGVDPQGPNGQSFWGLFVNFGNVTEGLTALDGKSRDVRPALATKWEWANDQDTKLNVTLRSGVKFQNGEVFDSAAVVSNMERVLDPKTKSAVSDWVKPITDVRAVDDSTVEFTTKESAPNLPSNLSAVMMIAPKQLKTGEITGTDLVGTGPYKLAAISAQAIVLETNPNYWGKIPAGAPKQVTLRANEEAGSRVAALESGEAAIAMDIPAELEDRVPKIEVAPQLDMVNFRFNGARGLTTDTRVRKAIVMGTNRDEIRKAIVGDKFSKPCTGNYVPPGVFGFDESREEPAYDPEGAKKLLQEAGVNGKTVKLVTTSRWPKANEYSQALAQQIEKLGLKVDLKVVPQQQWLDLQYAKQGNVEMVLAGAGSEQWDALTTYLKGPAPTAPLSTFPDKEFPAFGQALAEAVRTVDDDKREELLFKAQAVLQGDASYYLCAFFPVSVYGAQKNVSWDVRQDNIINFATIRQGQ